MAFDGIVTNSIVKELKNIIGYKIDKVYEPEKNTVILGLYGKSLNLMLLMCISSTNYRLHLTTQKQKNPSTAPNFCMLLRKYLIGLKIKNIYSGKATVSSADWVSVTVEFGGTVADADKIIPMAVGLQIYDGNHIPNIMINEKTPTSFTASCYGLSAFQWVVLELY